ncbi:MAG: hypothetical protein P1U37_10135 [Minwuia sp.]|nr:hypothetical protein [Minwuia sp.]
MTRGARLLCAAAMGLAISGTLMAEPTVTLRDGVRQHTDTPGKTAHQAGFGPDTFIFGPDNGHDLIAGFDPTEDRIILRNIERWPTYEKVARRVWSTPHGLFIGLSNTDSIRVAGSRPGDLTASNLIVITD